MPGYILHLTAAQIYLASLCEGCGICPTEEWRDKFFLGNLLPDNSQNKEWSHFRSIESKNQIIRAPQICVFLKKYQIYLNDPVCLGYYLHLFVDDYYYRTYLFEQVDFLNEKYIPTKELNELKWVKSKRNTNIVSRKDFFSKKYLYGDYSKMNPYFMEKYSLNCLFDAKVDRCFVKEAGKPNITKILNELDEYLKNKSSMQGELKVLNIEEIENMLHRIVHLFCMKMESLYSGESYEKVKKY